jgi:multicomponent K+:H+ antiporter subunit G
MNTPLPLWIELPVALLLVTSGVFTLAAGIGVLRLRSFFMRMHPPALAFSLSAWCVTLATILYFTARDGALSLHAWLIIIFLSITVPVTTTLLARTELFRRRMRADAAVPAPLSRTVAALPPEAAPAAARDAGPGARAAHRPASARQRQ